jgi:glycosyltransferase involved in cell wall biosynthesis
MNTLLSHSGGSSIDFEIKNKTQPKVSVIVPIYNVERYLHTCITSLVNQTLNEIEIILVNDASPDSSITIMRDYEKKYPEKIVVIDSKENLCQGGARNLGIQVARAPWIGFVDGDDFVHPDMFKRMYEKAESTNVDFVCVQSAAIYEDSDAKKELSTYLSWHPAIYEMQGTQLDNTCRERLMVYPTGGVWSKLWKKSLIIDNNQFFPEHVKFEDNYWSTSIYRFVNRYVLIDNIFYYYRQNLSSNTLIMNAPHHMDRIFIEEQLQKVFVQERDASSYHAGLEYICMTRYFYNTYTTFLKRYDTVDWAIVSRMKDFIHSHYPLWRKNRYLLSDRSLLYRIVVSLVYRFPHAMCYILRPLYKLRDMLKRS